MLKLTGNTFLITGGGFRIGRGHSRKRLRKRGINSSLLAEESGTLLKVADANTGICGVKLDIERSRQHFRSRCETHRGLPRRSSTRSCLNDPEVSA